MPRLNSYTDLDVYTEALREAGELFVLSKRFPSEERFSLTDQVRRSSRAVGSMVAESWARRRYPAAFVSKLTEAIGEAHEIQAWLGHARAAGYISEAEHADHDGGWQRIGGRLQRMIDRADDFCRPEAPAPRAP